MALVVCDDPRECPFCGSRHVEVSEYSATCMTCGACGPDVYDDKGGDYWAVRDYDTEIDNLREDAEIGRLVRELFDCWEDLRCLRTSQGKVAVCQTFGNRDGSANPVYFGDTLLDALRRATEVRE